MHLVRHGQSWFNVHFGKTRIDPGIVDPGLTEEGKTQAQAAGTALRGKGLTRLLASPYLRTLETAEIIASTLELPIVINPLVRERCFFTCDIGSARDELEARFPHLDFGMLEARWWPDPYETEEELGQRCRSFAAAMREDSGWRQTGVVTHWGFIRGLTGYEARNGEIVQHDLDAEAASAQL